MQRHFRKLHFDIPQLVFHDEVADDLAVGLLPDNSRDLLGIQTETCCEHSVQRDFHLRMAPFKARAHVVDFRQALDAGRDGLGQGT